MTRDEFMKELAYLLQDIQDEDKDDAVQYYTDYFEEAGPDKEAEVIQELGSPERIAAIIRADIAGHLEDGGEFTEQGYQDERFRDPGYAMAKRLDLPEERENGGQGNYSRRQGFNQKRSFNQKQSFDQEPGKTYTEGSNGTSQTPPPRTSKVIKLILWAVLIIVAFPLFLGVSGGLLGLAAGILGILAAILVMRLMNQGEGKKISLPEMNARINELLKSSIKSDGVINLFSDVKEEFSLFDPKFLEEISKMKEKNLAVELLKKLIAEQIQIYRRTNVVKSEKFSEIIQGVMNRYLNGMLTNEEVIEELLKMAQQIREAHDAGDELGLSEDELAFYDALTKPQAIKDFYENDELIAITKELTEALRKNRSIDWQKRDSARAKMRMMIKRLLKKHKYPPEGMDDAVATVMLQCELWTDNNDMEHRVVNYAEAFSKKAQDLQMVAEEPAPYGTKEED